MESRYPVEGEVLAIAAEIEALARLFADDPESMERLRVLLAHAPARFAPLIEEMMPTEVDPLVVLLRRLQVSGAKDLRKKASRWLQRLAEAEPAAPSWHGSNG